MIDNSAEPIIECMHMRWQEFGFFEYFMNFHMHVLIDVLIDVPYTLSHSTAWEHVKDQSAKDLGCYIQLVYMYVDDCSWWDTKHILYSLELDGQYEYSLEHVREDINTGVIVCSTLKG